MKVSWNWLCELLEVPDGLSAQTVADRLSVSGVAVDALHALGRGLSGCVVAEVRAKRPHPKADKLTLVDVFDGTEVTQVVCGAPNVPAPTESGCAPRVVWAKPGATLPSGLQLSVREVRGIASPGMLCAEDELGLSEDHAGILVLSSEDGLPIGCDFAKAAGLPDWIFELDITPNRPDLLGHMGVAREIAALFRAEGVKWKPLAVGPSALRISEGVSQPIDVTVEDPDGCPRYFARAICGVNVGKSPLFYRLRLSRLGVRALSNVVDATNLALLQFGHPLHAFDLDKLAGQKIVVRRGRPGETIKTLDSQNREVSAGDLLIADGQAGVAVAGVMGGETAEVGPTTQRVLLECAYFSPASIRRTSKRLKLHTEASHRFERGTDPNAIPEVADACAALIVQLAGGTIAASATDVYPKPIPSLFLALRPEKTRAVLGVDVPTEQQKECLTALGLLVTSDGTQLQVRVPTRRPDLTREIDLIEEVARIHGLQHVPATLPRQSLSDAPPVSPALCRLRNADHARALCASLGLFEVIQFSMTSPERVQLGEGSAHIKPLRIDNPLREELSVLRTRLLPGLLDVLHKNLAHGQTDVRLFEVGEVFTPTSAGSPAQHQTQHQTGSLPTEKTHVAAVLCGNRDHHLKPTAHDALDFYDAKGLVEALCEAQKRSVTVRAATAQEAPLFHPGAAAALCCAKTGQVVGVFGEIHPDCRRSLDLPCPVFAFELEIPDELPEKPTYLAPSRFPGTSRDLSCFVAEDLPVSELFHAMRHADEPLLRGVSLLEDYREKGHVPVGQKALLFSLTYRSDERTLTDDEVQKAHQKVVSALGHRHPISLRA